MSMDDRPNHDRDAQRSQVACALLRATRMRCAAVGRYSFRARTVLDADVSTAAERDLDLRDQAIAMAVLTISRTLGPHERRVGRPSGEVGLTLEGSGAEAITWLTAARCLVGLWHCDPDVAAFVALIRGAGEQDFPRWQRDVARIALLYEGERMQWARSAAVIAQAPAPALPAATEIIRHVALGLALVDEGRRVVYTNDAAQVWLAGQTALRIGTDGRVCARPAELHKRLCAAVKAASQDAPREPSVLIFPGRGEAGPPLAVTCAPLGGASAYALLIFGEKSCNRQIADLLLNALGLTCAERRLACHLLAGETLEDAARAANIKLSTARSYLKGIFAKTGVRRQSELIAVVGGMVPPVKTNPNRSDERPRGNGAA